MSTPLDPDDYIRALVAAAPPLSDDQKIRLRALLTSTPDLKVWLTTEELAQRLRTAPGTVRYWRHAGKGPRGTKFGRRVLYDLAEVERWETEQSQHEDNR